MLDRTEKKKRLYDKIIIFLLLMILLFTSACNVEHKIKERQAREYFNNNQYSKVIETLETIKPSRRSARINLLLGKTYCIQFEFDKADQIFNNTFKRFPSFKDSIITTYLFMAERFEKRKRSDLAIKAYNSVLDIESEYNIDMGFYLLGHYYYDRNDLMRAKELLEKGVENIKDKRVLRKAKVELLDIYEKIGMLKEAIDISAGDPSKDIIFRRGKISYRLAKDFFTTEEFDSAITYCETVLGINSPRTLIDDTYFLMGEIYSSRGNYRDAIQCYKEVIKLDKFGNNELASIAKKKIEILTKF